MDFEPKSKEEIERELLLPAGTYDFEVVEAEEKMSKGGNSMIALQLLVFGDDGSRHYLRDWLVAKQGRCQLKIASFCESVGLESVYMDGSLTDQDCLGRAGRATVKQVHSESFGLQAVIGDYEKDAAPSKPTGVPAQQQAAARDAIPDGDIPF